jgi:hypothetical protein
MCRQGKRLERHELANREPVVGERRIQPVCVELARVSLPCAIRRSHHLRPEKQPPRTPPTPGPAVRRRNARRRPNVDNADIDPASRLSSSKVCEPFCAQRRLTVPRLCLG